MPYPTIDETHDPELTSWVPGADDHAEFPIQNLPFGVFSADTKIQRIGVAIGDYILDVASLGEDAFGDFSNALREPKLNRLLSLQPTVRHTIRRRLSKLLSDQLYRSAIEPLLHAASDCTLHLPADIGDYTDFYTGIHHAMNVGRLFRPDNPLLPNYKHVPIGYHGRSSSIRPSGEDVKRPKGQQRPLDIEGPVVRPSEKLDYEVELGFWIGHGNALGTPISIEDAAEHIAGICLLNDWSARDVQTWEYQPLGPFLSKSFHSTISPWVVTAEALAPFRVAQAPRPAGDPQPLPYLMDQNDQGRGSLALCIEAYLSTQEMRDRHIASVLLSRSAATDMYWTAAQMVAHHTVAGCNLNPGDLLGSGTISAADPAGYGSLLEISSGREPLRLPTGEERIFLEDGDQVQIRAHARAEGCRSIGLGACDATVVR